MSLILTHIGCYGVVHAADSNLTAAGAAAGTGDKVFEVPALRAGLSLAGSYTVSGERMDTWMPRAISDYVVGPSPTLTGLAAELARRLAQEMTVDEKTGGYLIHVAGFVTESEGQHPEFHFVRNISGIDPDTGNYLGIGPTFDVTEDFWARDCVSADDRTALENGERSQLYINGFPAGRIAYLGLGRYLDEFLSHVWGNPDWSFRPPRTLGEVELFLRLRLSLIGTLFEASDYSAPLIGGPVKTLQIPA